MKFLVRFKKIFKFFILFTFAFNLFCKAGYSYVVLSSAFGSVYDNLFVVSADQTHIVLTKNIKTQARAIADNTKSMLTLTGVIDRLFVEDVQSPVHEATIINDKDSDTEKEMFIDNVKDRAYTINENILYVLYLSKYSEIMSLKHNIYDGARKIKNILSMELVEHRAILNPGVVYLKIKQALLMINLGNHGKVFLSIVNIIKNVILSNY